ncbi:rhodanese-like domain-containing protein [Bacteriovoracaceae bacterium]|nr:rhodanese-like domain-containing protein [Bacteriovoracaceae bacterium]
MRFFFIILFISNYAQSQSEFEVMAKNMASKFGAPIMSVEQLKSEGKVVIFDARELKEFNISHIPGANFVGFQNFDIAQIKAKFKKENKIVVYCSVGYRSGKIAQILNEQGFKAFNLLGGIFDWSNKGHDLRDSKEKKTSEIHSYNSDWSKWLTRGKIIN